MAIDLVKDFASQLDAAINSCAHHPADLPLPQSVEEARQYWDWFQKCRPDARKRHLRQMAKSDLYFLGRYILGWEYAEHPWQFERAREMQAHPDGVLDLWSRGHMKTHWKTYALTIQEILNNPEVTIIIFSWCRPIAKAFLRVIKQQLESCELLKELFPEILWANTDEAPKWSEDDGICVKRSSIRLEQTVEASGLIDGQPTSKHFDIRIYDDIVTQDLVTNADRIADVTNKWELSVNCGVPGSRERYNGTFYHENDTYHTMIDRGVVEVRRHPIFYEDGPLKGQPVFFTHAQVDHARKTMSIRNFAFQCLLDPKQDTTQQRWDTRWLRRYLNPITSGVNVYIIVDPASKKKQRSDYTTMGVIGLGADRNYYLLHLIRDKFDLKQRTAKLFELHQQYTSMGAGMKPKAVGYEQYGKDSDIEHIQEKMDEFNYHFSITDLGGRLAKEDRINALLPSFQESRWFLPDHIYISNWRGEVVEVISEFIQEEFAHMPTPKHDDTLDMLARILDPKLGATFPIGQMMNDPARKIRDYPEPRMRPRTWMGV